MGKDKLEQTVWFPEWAFVLQRESLRSTNRPTSASDYQHAGLDGPTPSAEVPQLGSSQTPIEEAATTKTTRHRKTSSHSSHTSGYRTDGIAQNVQHLLQLHVGDAVRRHEDDGIADGAGQYAAFVHLSADFDAHSLLDGIRTDLYRADEAALTHINNVG